MRKKCFRNGDGLGGNLGLVVTLREVEGAFTFPMPKLSALSTGRRGYAICKRPELGALGS